MEILRIFVLAAFIILALWGVSTVISLIRDQLRIRRLNKMMDKLLEDDLRVSEELEKRLEKELGNLDKD